MDLGSRLANLSLAEIATMLNTKQQEVLLASISVAARFIQQLQAEEQLKAEEQQLQADELQIGTQPEQLLLQQADDLHLQQQPAAVQQQQHNHHHHPHHPHHHQSHHHQQQQQQQQQHHNQRQHHRQQPQQQQFHQDQDDDIDDDDDDDQHVNDQSSDISFDEYSPVTQADHLSTADNQTLLTIREFAEELKSRRKLIRLSQKGAAQSLRAFTGGEQPCTDAIIYHFENLQLEPERAMQLIPLLRDWLDWAEKHRLDGKQLPMMNAVTKVPRERKRKVVLFNEKSKQYLEEEFLKNNHPDRYQLDIISQELNIPTRSIRKWFTNRRQRKRFAEKFSPLG